MTKKKVKKKRSTSRPLLRRDDLLRLPKEKLAQLLAEQIAGLPYSQRKQWIRRYLPKSVASETITKTGAPGSGGL